MAAALAVTSSGSPSAAKVEDAHPVIELRQYKIVAGKRDAMIALFEREFVDSQEVLGMQLVGLFRDAGDPNRFTWIRAFDDSTRRAERLGAFYYGPVWKAHRDEANPMLEDNDNVLLLRPAQPGSGFTPHAQPHVPAKRPGKSGMVIATIYYLWKDPGEGFTAFFRDRLEPAYAGAGLPVLASYVPESEPNAFPKLPVRQNEKVFVWFTRADDDEAYGKAEARLKAEPGWRAVSERLADYQERSPQVLRLLPTSRSALR